jgi:hypothetical protein
MCQPKSRGGRRCATHTYPAYSKALEGYRTGSWDDVKTQGQLLRTATNYASTPTGSARITQDIEEYLGSGQNEIGEILSLAREKGLENMKTYREKEALIAQLTQRQSLRV